MNVKLTTETARRSALILKETTHASVLRVLCHWCLSYFFSLAYFSFYRVICDIPWRQLIHHTQSSYLTHKMQTVFFSGGWAFFLSLSFLLFGFSSIVLYFFLFLFCIVLFFSLRASRTCIKFDCTKWKMVSLSLSLSLSLSSLFSCPYFLFAFHKWVFWWDKLVWQSRELPQHSW